MDIFSRDKRSGLMAKIGSRDTKPELLIRSYLFKNGFRYRKNLATLPGKPDVVLPKYKTVIFIHGCFWHGHSCNLAKLPKTNTEFWRTKIELNKTRDAKNISLLLAQDWKVIEVWQCEIKTKGLLLTRLALLVKQITSS